MFAPLNVGGAPGQLPIKLPLDSIARSSWLEAFLSYPPVRAMTPVPILVIILPLIWWFFRSTWADLELEATDYRAQLARKNRFDTRPLVCLIFVAVTLTVQEYYGGRRLYDSIIRPWLFQMETTGWHKLHLAQFDEYYSYAWWVAARVIGYVLLPFPIWKFFTQKTACSIWVCEYADSLGTFGSMSRA